MEIFIIIFPVAVFVAVKLYDIGLKSTFSPGINELTSLAEEAKCQRNSKDECGRGTVRMDPWLSQTLAFQRRLGENLTLDKQQFLGSHNSFNNRADG